MVPTASTSDSLQVGKANPWLSIPARIEDIREELDSVATWRLRLLDEKAADTFRFAPGQFNMLYVPGCGEVAISMSGPDADAEGPIDGRRIVHTIRTVGRVTEAIAKLKVGDEIGVRGPFGTPWPMDAMLGRNVVLVSGGLGMAPLRPVLYRLIRNRAQFGRLRLLYGVRSPDLVLYGSELDAWRAAGIEIEQTVDRADEAWQGAVGTVPLLIDRLKGPGVQDAMVCICGPEIMMHFSARSALQIGIPAESIWLSMERHMQCAFGMCGHCQWGPHFVCHHGPVLRYDNAAPWMNTRDL